jgi:hypothetical protein
MNKTVKTTLLVLVSGLTLSTTALAGPFEHGSGYVNATSNAVSSDAAVRTVESVRLPATVVTASGFNSRSVVENQDSTVGGKSEIGTASSGMFTARPSQFNDRG